MQLHPFVWRMFALLAVLAFALPSTARAQNASRPSGTLVTTNMNDNTASLIDVNSERVVAVLPTGVAPHEVSVSHDGRWAIVSNYGVRGKPGNTLTVIDLPAAAVSRTIDLGDVQRPHGSAFLPGDTLLAVTSEVRKAIAIVDVRSGAVVRMVPTNGRVTHMLGLALAGDRMVTSNIADGTISVLSFAGVGASEREPTVIKVAAQPEGIAIAPDGNTAWVGSDRDSVVDIVDTQRAAVIDTLRGFGLPYRLAISRNGALAVITDPVKAVVRVFDAHTRRERYAISIARDSLVPTAEVPGSPSPEGVTITPDSRWAFVTLQGRNRVITIALRSGTIVGIAPTGTWSDGVAYSPIVIRRIVR